MSISPSQIFAKIKDSEIIARREPEKAEKLMKEAKDLYAQAAAGRSEAGRKTLLEGVAHQSKLRTTQEFTARYGIS